MVGALCGGALGASSVAQVPVRMAAFAAMTWLLETIDASGATSIDSVKKQLWLSTLGLDEARRWRYVGNKPRKGTAETPRTNVFGEPVGSGVRAGSRIERWIESLNRQLGHTE
jgi:hypothetical protein